jgi:uncharacterized membrane protein
MAETDGTQIDDRPEERESPVRHAHAVRASRHGRASTPGYLGLPIDEDEGHGVDASEDEDDARREGDEEDRNDGEDESRHDENPRSRAPRARGAGGSSRSSGDGPSRSTAKQSSPSQRKQPSSRSAKASTRGDTKSKRAATKSRDSAKPSAGGKRARSTSAGGGTRKTSSARGSRAKSKASNAGASAKPAGGSRGGGRKAASAARKAASAARKSSSSRSAGEPAAERTKSAAASVKRKVSSAANAADDGLLERAISVLTHRVEGSMRRKAAAQGLRLAALLARHGSRGLVRAASRATSRALSRAGAAGTEGLLERAQRMPIQQSIDVAVPPAVAWEQWMEFTYFPEGSRRVVDVERDDDVLEGHLDGLTSREWEAEIIDERECESFAWRSIKGSDSAGLVTFHELAERLTRIELNLDVRPTDLGEAAGLALRLADHRVRSELRRFKAHAELLSPDIYDELLGSSGNGGPPDDAEDFSPEDDDGSSEE